ncbi:MAG: tRNA (guanosine(46)-N7)-methyltransferase TrmB [Rhodothermales bacterium]
MCSIVLSASSLAFPSSSEHLFGRRAPLVAEVGVGSGGFIANLAKRRPDVNILGIDRAPQSIARSYRRLLHDDIRNARLFKGDAEWFVRNVIPAGGLDRVYVNFPDPWPRKKHHERRLLQASFLRLLASRLAADGDVLVTTDHEEYFQFVLHSAEEAACYHVVSPDPTPEVLETKWARKADVHYHAVLSPSDEVADVHANVEVTDTMYHAVVGGSLPDFAPFERRTFTYRDGVVVLMDAYRPLSGTGVVFLVHVEEKGLTQEVLVEVREGKEGFVVALRRFGEPLHTRGLRAAVRVITEWLVEQGMDIIHRKY